MHSFGDIPVVSQSDTSAWTGPQRLEDPLKNMTLRGLDPDLEAALKRVAAQHGKSVNQTALDALRKGFGLVKEKRFTAVHDDLDHLFGRWSEEEFQRIQTRIDAARKVDEELWR